MTEPILQRPFVVHGEGEAVGRTHLVEGLTFEDAALRFLESHQPLTGDAEVAVYIEDCETGERQCLRVDLATGETAPCD
jgi:Family of unknown function (DUF5961)